MEAMRLMGPILKIACIIWVVSALEKLLQQAYGIIQIESVASANCDVKFPYELRAKCLPIVLQDVSQVVMFAPVRRHFMIYYSCIGVPYWLRITIRPNRTEHSLPCIPIATRPAMGAAHELHPR